jgi:hypothetical protein
VCFALIEEVPPLAHFDLLDADRHDTGSVPTVMGQGNAGAGSKNFMGAAGARERRFPAAERRGISHVC